MDSGDLAWMMISTALVVFMVPGLALFYGGMTKGKNVLNMLIMNMYCIGIIPILWVVLTYSLGNSGGGETGFFGGAFLGDFDAVGLSDLNLANGAADDLVGVMFLMTFAAITPALISGAVAGRMRFAAWALFVPVWSLLVYSPVTYWVYTGWHVTKLNPEALDLAGGTAIHVNAGVAALAVVLVLGNRRGWPATPSLPHNLPLVIIGTGILWFGWFGFNAGSVGGANGLAVVALLNTFLSASAGMIGWLLIERLRDGHATTLGAASGVVAGLVAITPAASHVGTLVSIIFGLVAAVLCYFAIQLKTKLGYDDSLDVVGIHGVGGVAGGLLLGLFADANVGGHDGLFFGEPKLLLSQIIAIGSVILFSFVVTYVIAKALDATVGLRVDDDVEAKGLDIAEHAEAAYT